MREILFRGKWTDNGEWVYGYYTYVSSAVHINELAGNHIIYRNPKDPDDIEMAYIVSGETVGQYTGLTDKNGKKIFEGDIVKTRYANTNYKEHIEVVVFEGGAFKAMTKYGNGSVTEPLYDGTPHLATDKSVYMDSIEVIGNIYDNPQLLDGGDNGKLGGGNNVTYKNAESV